LESLKRHEDRLEGVGVGGKEIYRWILRKLVARMWDGFIWLRMGYIDGLSWIQ
jgi:hypothetical protein